MTGLRSELNKRGRPPGGKMSSLKSVCTFSLAALVLAQALPPAQAQAESQNKLYGSAEFTSGKSEARQSDTLVGFVRPADESNDRFDTLSGLVTVCRNPNNRFVSPASTVVGLVYEPFDSEDAAAAIGAGAAIFTGIMGIMNAASGSGGGVYTGGGGRCADGH